MEDVTHYIGVIINFELLRKNKVAKVYSKFNNKFYDCIYKYSHRKLSVIFSDPILRFLYEDFVESGNAHRLIQNDETMKKHEELYERVIKVFLNSFSKGLYCPKLEDNDS